MPELPEVHALAGFLDARLRGRRITSVRIASVAALKTVDPPVSDLAGREITGVRRIGKQLVIDCDGLLVAAHLSRGGWVRWHEVAPASTAAGARRSGLAARFEFDDGSALDLTEQGSKKRLAIAIARSADAIPSLARLGPDALAVARGEPPLADILATAGRRPLKTVLADQSLIAGIGNAFSDEILHAARLSPFRPAAALTVAEQEALVLAIRNVLSEALAQHSGARPDQMKEGKRSGLQIHNHAGEPCPVCGDEIRFVDLGARTIEYCPRCQTGGTVYADRRLSRLIR